MEILRRLLPNHSPLRLFYHKLKAVLAAFLYRFPANDMVIVGVTGTNGKTTTSNMIHAVFMEAGQKCGLMTTVNYKIGDVTRANRNKQTTPGPFFVQRMLREMVKAGCKVAVVETTSHAMVQHRLWGVNVDTAVFTNLTHDHVEYHGSAEAYREAKGQLFANLNTSRRKPGVPKVSIVNHDDAAFDYFAGFAVDQLLEYGIQKGTYVARDLQLRPNGTTFTLKVPNGEAVIDLKFPGRMNVYNAMAAASVGVAHKINVDSIKTALERVKPEFGRLQPLDEGQPYTIVVDYAHAEDSLQQLLKMFRELTQGNLIVVFGCTGGGRDREKRPRMGKIAHDLADKIILTDDDPYEEDRFGILEQIAGGIPRQEGEGLWMVVDRKEAIHLALSMAKESDTVVIAGKGGEEVQVIGKEKFPYDDRQVVKEILSRPVDIEVPV